MSSLDIAHVKPLFDTAKTISILLPKNPSHDAVASALACKLSFDGSGKFTTVVCETPITVEHNRLVGVDTIINTFGSPNLIISFDDQTDYVDKVSYNIDKGELQLLITPKPNTPRLDHTRLKFVPSQGISDLILVIGANSTSDLGSLYATGKDMFAKSKVVSLTLTLPQENYTQSQIFQPGSSSLSEIVSELFEALNARVHDDIATNLFSGLVAATDNFQAQSVTHVTFEIASRLMRQGAARHQPLSASNFPAGSIPTQSFQAPVQSQSQQSQPPTPTNQLGYGTDSQPVVEEAPANPPADWYEPKIYHGPMLQ